MSLSLHRVHAQPRDIERFRFLHSVGHIMTIKNKILSLRQSLNNSVARLRKNEDGIAAIEFAFTVPMFIALYYGLAESAHAISMDKRISHAAYVAGDLATQVETITSSDMTDIMYAALRIAGVEDSSKIKMEIHKLLLLLKN